MLRALAVRGHRRRATHGENAQRDVRTSCRTSRPETRTKTAADALDPGQGDTPVPR